MSWRKLLALGAARCAWGGVGGLVLAVGVLALSLVACGSALGNNNPQTTLRIVSGSENQTLEPIVKRFYEEGVE